jgi:hypothetical protein
MPKAPDHIQSDEELVDWFFKTANFGWLELDLEIDISSWKPEAKYAEYVKHRGTAHEGWQGSCIHGIDVHCTDSWTAYSYTKEEDVPYQWTSLSEHTPEIKKFWTKFPYETYRRIRFMNLEPQGFILPHNDAPGNLPGEENINLVDFGVPINVAIIHPEACYMTLEDYGVVPWKEGKIMIVNILKNHSVINLSSHQRVHLIAHGIPKLRKKEFISLIARSYKKQYERDQI